MTTDPNWQLVPKEITELMANSMECQFSTEGQWKAALAAAPTPPQSNWQTIESAPKDGTHILVTRAPSNGKTPYKIAWKHEVNEKRPYWRIGVNKALRWAPTHWQHLPPPALNGDK